MATDDEKPDPTPDATTEPASNDPRAKELLTGKPLEEMVDAATAAELARWFGLPSFQQVDEGEVKLPAEDPEMLAVRERRAKAIAAVDPALLEAHRRRVEATEGLLKFEATIDVCVDLDLPLFDADMAERRSGLAEPREVERPEDLSDALAECTPQALLRDLHRPELMFDKEFEVVDVAAEQKLDAVAAVREAIATSWKLPELGDPSGVAIRRIMGEVRAERDAPWIDIPRRAHLPNRRIED